MQWHFRIYIQNGANSQMMNSVFTDSLEVFQAFKLLKCLPAQCFKHYVIPQMSRFRQSVYDTGYIFINSGDICQTMEHIHT